MELFINPYNTIIEKNKFNYNNSNHSHYKEYNNIKVIQVEQVELKYIPLIKEHFLLPFKNILFEKLSNNINSTKIHIFLVYYDLMYFKEIKQLEIELKLIFDEVMNRNDESLVTIKELYICNNRNNNTSKCNIKSMSIDNSSFANQNYSEFVLITNDEKDSLIEYSKLVIHINDLVPLDTELLELLIDIEGDSNETDEIYNIEYKNTLVSNSKIITFEILSQTIFLLKYVIKQTISNINNNTVSNNSKTPSSDNQLSLKYFNNSLNVLYLLEQEHLKKNYRKREITISSKEVRYISLVSILNELKNYNNIENNNKISLKDYLNNQNIKVFFQRNPQFYFSNSHLANKLIRLLKENGIKIIDDFFVFDILYIRSNMMLKFNNYIDKLNNNNEIKEFIDYYNNSNSNSGIFVQDIKIPDTLVLRVSNDNDSKKESEVIFLDSNSSLNSNNKNIKRYLANNYQLNDFLRKGIIIKEDYSGNHNMRVLLADNTLDTLDEQGSKRSSTSSLDESYDSENTLMNQIIQKLRNKDQDRNNNRNDSSNCHTTYIIQKLIPHNEILIKVYYLNNKIKLVLRKSINPINLARMNQDPRSSCKYNKDKDLIFIEFKTEDLYSDKDLLISEEEKLLLNDLNDYFLLICKNINKEFIVNMFNVDFLLNIKLDNINEDKENKKVAVLYLIEINFFPSYKEYFDQRKEEFDKHIINISNEY